MISETIPGKKNNNNKDTELGVSLVCLRNIKVTGAEG